MQATQNKEDELLAKQSLIAEERRTLLAAKDEFELSKQQHVNQI